MKNNLLIKSVFILFLSTMLNANSCPKWFPMPSSEMVVVIPIYNPSITGPDMDCDGLIDSVDSDIDGDGISNTVETAHGTNPRNPDTDGDGVSDGNDAFPLNASETTDTDGDGIGNNEDTNDDDDWVLDVDDPDPLDPKVIAFNGVRYDIVTSPYTGYEWLDRNMGASQACMSFDDAQCYGDYYQWGRDADGHESNFIATTITQSPSITPAHSYFIKQHIDWTSDDTSGILRAWSWSQRYASVCPTSFRIPTIDELNAELFDTGSAEIENRVDAFNSFLKLPSAGYRDFNTAIMKKVGLRGYIWSVSMNGYYIYFDDIQSVNNTNLRAGGQSIRCMRAVKANEPPVIIGAHDYSRVQFAGYSGDMPIAVDDRDGIMPVIQQGMVNGDVVGTYPISYLARDSAGEETIETVIVTVTPFNVIYNGTSYGAVKSPYTSKVWLDRNLGASRVCLGFDDPACYGDYYQWGRSFDGHQNSSSNITTVLATNVNSAGLDYIANTTVPKDWASIDETGTIRSTNWSKTDASVVCPVNFRVPTINELNTELLDVGSANIHNRNDAFGSFLKLPSAGYRSIVGTTFFDKGNIGYVWSTAVDSTMSKGISFSSNTAIENKGNRAIGLSVRCLRN